jgi:site-specific recombinase XerD
MASERATPLFRTLNRRRELTTERMLRQDAWAMIKRRAPDAGVTTASCCHTFRATAITEFVRNGGSVENARKLAAHASCRTTNMYVRIDEEMKQEEVERVRV